MSNCSSTITDISKVSLLIILYIDNYTNISIFEPKTKTVYIKFILRNKLIYDLPYANQHLCDDGIKLEMGIGSSSFVKNNYLQKSFLRCVTYLEKLY